VPPEAAVGGNQDLSELVARAHPGAPDWERADGGARACGPPPHGGARWVVHHRSSGAPGRRSQNTLL
jgi:hypothetical protein